MFMCQAKTKGKYEMEFLREKKHECMTLKYLVFMKQVVKGSIIWLL